MYGLKIKLHEKRNRVGDREYRLYYIHLPRKIVSAIGMEDGDEFDVKIVTYRGRQAILLIPVPGEGEGGEGEE